MGWFIFLGDPLDEGDHIVYYGMLASASLAMSPLEDQTHKDCFSISIIQKSNINTLLIFHSLVYRRNFLSSS